MNEKLLSIQAINIESPVIFIENDIIAEYNETFSVTLSSNDKNVIVPEQTALAEILIIDNDSKFTYNYYVAFAHFFNLTAVTVGFTSSVYEANEGDVNLSVCISSNGTTERNVSLTISVVGGTATGMCISMLL